MSRKTGRGKRMKLPNNIKKIFNLFQQFDKQIYLVGGCVRDLIMGVAPHDYDFTTDATPDEMKKIAHLMMSSMRSQHSELKVPMEMVVVLIR